MNNNSPSPARRRVAIAVAAVFATGVLVAGAIALKPSRAASAQGAPQPIPVMVASVLRSEVATWDEFSGRLEAVERVDVRSRVAGAVQSVHFREGALVKAGDLLITIDPAPYAADVERAEAQVAAAQARLNRAQGDHARSQRLWEERAISQRE